MDISRTSSSLTLGEITTTSSNSDEAVTSSGSLEGITITPVDHQRVTFPSFSSVSSLLSEGTSHESSPTISNVTNPSSPEPPSTSPSASTKKEIPCFNSLETKKKTLEEKIKTAEEVSFCESIPNNPELKEHQEIYIKDLKCALNIITEAISLQEDPVNESVLCHTSETVQPTTPNAYNLESRIPDDLNKIEQTVDLMILVTEEMQSHRSFLMDYKTQHQGKELPYNGALGTAREALLHYRDYASSLKNTSPKESPRDLYWGNACLSAFKLLQSKLMGRNDLATLHTKARFCYEQARELDARAPILAAFSNKAGNNFLNAATALEAGALDQSELYTVAGNSTEKAVKIILEKTEGHYAKKADLLTLKGISVTTAAESLKMGKRQLSEFYRRASQCYSDSFHALCNSKAPDLREISKQLHLAGNSFSDAAAALAEGKIELHQLHVKIAECCLEITQEIRISGITHSNKIELLEKASTYFSYAAEELITVTEGNKSRSLVYKMGGEYAKKAALATNPAARAELKNTNRYYSYIVDELDKGGSETSNAIQLFKSAIKYSLQAAALLEQETPSTNKRTSQKVGLLVATAAHLSQAGKASQQGNEVLSSQYHDLAASQHAFAEAIQSSSDPDGSQNDNLMSYWSTIVTSHQKKLAELLAS